VSKHTNFPMCWLSAQTNPPCACRSFHKCPHNVKSRMVQTKFEGQSEAQQAFVAHAAAKRAAAFRPKGQKMMSGEFYSETEMRAQYTVSACI